MDPCSDEVLVNEDPRDDDGLVNLMVDDSLRDDDAIVKSSSRRIYVCATIPFNKSIFHRQEIEEACIILVI